MDIRGSRSLSESTNRMAKTEKYKLRRILSGWQIFYIIVTVIMGPGCFTDYGIAAKTAGPLGLLIALVVVGVIAICAMEGLSEMIQLFPTVNPIVELVHFFVDKDLALWVGISYWYAYASYLPFQVIRAASYLDYYVDAEHGGWLATKIVLFYVVTPGIIALINCLDVRIYAFIESVSGFSKMVIFLVVIFVLYYIAGAANSAKHINYGLVSELKGSETAGSAICLVIEVVAFTFLGIESIAMTAFEAKDSAALRIPSKLMAYIVFVCYFIFAIAANLCLDWKNTSGVPDFVDRYVGSQSLAKPGSQSGNPSALTLAAEMVGELSLARAMNGMLIFYAVSNANSTVYVSSRMLYGLAYVNRWRNNRLIYWLATVKENGVPRNAVLVSVVTFSVWLPFTQINPRQTIPRFLSWFFFTAGDVCGFFMWTSVSIAYIRYWFAFYIHRNSDFLKDPRFRRFRRAGQERDDRGFSTLLDWAQPVPAFVGLAGSILIVWVFSTSAFWGRRFTAREFVQNYSLPVLLPILFITWKMGLWTWRVHKKKTFFKESLMNWWYKFDDEDELKGVIEQLSGFRDLGSGVYTHLP